MSLKNPLFSIFYKCQVHRVHELFHTFQIYKNHTNTWLFKPFFCKSLIVKKSVQCCDYRSYYYLKYNVWCKAPAVHVFCFFQKSLSLFLLFFGACPPSFEIMFHILSTKWKNHRTSFGLFWVPLIKQNI